MHAVTPIKELRESQDSLKKEIESCNGDITPLTARILDGIVAGSLDPDFFDHYWNQTRNPSILAAGLRQSKSFYVRSKAIHHIPSVLRSRNGFIPLWDALGGARAVASLMRGMSVVHVQALCEALASASLKPSQRLERQQGISDLLKLLCPLNGTQADPEIHDGRPLKSAYMRLVKGCTLEVTRKWFELNKSEWSVKDVKRFSLVHGDAWRDQEVNEVFAVPEGQTLHLDRLQQFVDCDRKFTVPVLRMIIEHPDPSLKVNSSQVLNNFILPLVQYIHRSSPPHEFRYEAWSLIHAAMVRWPECARHSLADCAIKYWTFSDFDGDSARKSKVWTLVSGVIACILKQEMLTTRNFPKWIKAAKFEDRFHLLKYLLRVQETYGFDISYPTSAENLAVITKASAQIPRRLFTMIPARDAITFLDLLAEAEPQKVYIVPDTGGNFYSLQSEPGSQDIDILTLRARILQASDLEQRRASHLSEVQEEIKRRRELSSRSRDPSVRQFWASSALKLSIASGSLDTYSETLRWARRFKRDPVVNSTLLNQYLDPIVHALHLMSGINPNIPLGSVKEFIEKGNEIVLGGFEVAADLREPTSPPPSDLWRWTGFASKLAKARIRLVGEFQALHSLSDDEIFEMVWQPTISLLIEAERLGLEAVQGELGSSCMRGVSLFEYHESPVLKSHVWRFVDELARARDKLWYQERAKRRPAVLTLPDPWPKGLPIQCLLPFFLLRPTKDSQVFNKEYAQGFDASRLSYILERAHTLVFFSGTNLVRSPPQDEETVLAIRGFVDDYAIAVGLLVHGQGVDKEKTSTEIWEHCLEHLTAGRLSEQEAIYFWRRWLFGRDGVFNHLPKPSKKLPPTERGVGFPQWNTDDGPVAWDPIPRIPSNMHETDEEESWKEAEKAMCKTSIWHMLRVSKYHPKSQPLSFDPWFGAYNSNNYPFHVPISTYEAAPNMHPPETGASIIAREMLILNGQHGADSGLLMQPFPSSGDARFPAIYLADEFLESKFYKPACRTDHLEDRIVNVPPDLLYRLTSSVFKKMTSSGERVTAQAVWTCMGLVKTLGKSDRPSLACEFVRDVILTRPQDSSWHRAILHEGFLSRLLPIEAKEFLLDLAHAIVGKMQVQAKQNLEEGKDAPDPVPHVKVTVVKMIAQLMRGAQFIDQQIACDVLVAILKNARHIDIRAAAVSVLVDYLAKSPPDADISAIIEILETEVVPIAAGFDERYPMTEDRWAEAEKTGEMPHVTPGTSNIERPIREELWTATTYQLSRPEWKGRWHTTLMAKTIEQSRKNNARWMALFLRVNSLSLAEGELLPALPIDLTRINDYLSDKDHPLPIETFNMIRQVTMEYLWNPPKSITAAVRDSPALLKSNAGQHWLSIWDSPGTKTPGNVLSLLAKRLADPPLAATASSQPGMTTTEDIRDFLSSVADVLISKDIHVHLLFLIDDLIDSQSSHYRQHPTEESQEIYRSNAVSLVKHIISRIESIRSSPEWRTSKNRTPSRLPDTFPLHWDVIRGLYTFGGMTLPDMAIELCKLLDDLLGDKPRPYYHVKWNQLKQEVLKLPSNIHSSLALELAENLNLPVDGWAEGELSLKEYLLVELTLELVRSGWHTVKKLAVDDPLRDKVRGMLYKLIGSQDEVVREGAVAAFRVISPDSARGSDAVGMRSRGFGIFD